MSQRVAGYVFAVWRLTWALLICMVSDAPSLVAYGLLEVAMGAAAVVNTMRAREFDNRKSGWLLPCLYSLGYVVVPVGGVPGPVSVAFLWLVLGFRASCLLYLGARFSVGVATFVEVESGGPYAFVRHPMQLAGVLARLGVTLTNPCAWNWLASLIMVAACVGIVRLEESFLVGFDSYRAYVDRVRWRLLPGVW